MSPLRTRILPVLGLMLCAPVCAEYLQAYLPMTGQLLVQAAALLLLGPLYGGAALLIREVAVRTGRGWSGTLLLASAFGVLMPGVVDLSLWCEHRADVSYWDDMRGATLLPALGFAVYPMVSWVTGHVLYSIGAPLVLLDALAPRHRRRSLLGPAGIAVVAVLCAASAALIHHDARAAGVTPSTARQAAVVAVAVALVAMALSPLGRPATRPDPTELATSDGQPTDRATSDGQPVDRPWWTPARVFAAGLGAALAVELLPWTWEGTAAVVLILVAAGVAVGSLARRRPWTVRHVTALAVAGLVARCLTGLLAPLPPGVSVAARCGQSVVLLGLVVVVAWLASRTTAEEARTGR